MNVCFLFLATSGKGTTIICNSMNYCYIDCYLDACNDLTVVCNQCGGYDIWCDEDSAELSDNCPNGFDISSLESDYGLDLSISLEDTNINGYSVCSSNDAFNCGDYFDNGCVGRDIEESDTICCSGSYSCEKTNITSTQGDVRCDGTLIYLINLSNVCLPLSFSVLETDFQK